MKKLVGVSHPVPSQYAERIYNQNKTVFVGKRCLCQVSEGDKFILYESQGLKSYTGWADIKYINKIKTDSVIMQYQDKLMLTKEELKDYSKGRDEMFVIEFKNFEKFETPVKPSRFVPISGKYIYKREFNYIRSNKSNKNKKIAPKETPI